ncbi:unnamed protein product [Didymodactylos carnosus]|uniref:Ubiquitin-like domain-containing protein n=1 Tax=Didymodactylos carnosus TaxID=1234261 RepID=A0A815JGP1_9BILA|nr:unnamed protein product [Didymodactylos carnosus]CAF4272718.1 unnamed protein product [Didymodactylos carnosus]
MSATIPVVTTTVDRVNFTVTRKSDGQSLAFSLPEKSSVKDLKNDLKARLPPQFQEGCRLICKGKIMKGKHKIHHYGFKNGTNGVPILMDDSKNWESSSSSSDSEKSS